MGREYLDMNLAYNIQDERFRICGSLNLVGQAEVIETFLRGQIGKGRRIIGSQLKERYIILG